MKVKCVKCLRGERYFTPGKVYEVENGRIISDEGFIYNRKTNDNVLEFLSRWYLFKEVKATKSYYNETIVIYRKDNEVIALDKATGKKAIAKCSPEDTFDFNIGAKLAFERLMNGNKESITVEDM